MCDRPPSADRRLPLHVALVAVAILMTPEPSRGQDAGAERTTWVAVERLFQGDQATTALAASRRAVAEHPNSRALLEQHRALLVTLGGPPATAAWIDSLRTQAVDAATLAGIEVGHWFELRQNGRAADALARTRPRPETMDPFMDLLDRVSLHVGSDDAARWATADSLLTVLDDAARGTGYLDRWLYFAAQTQRAVLIGQRGDLESAMGEQLRLAELAASEGFYRWALRCRLERGIQFSRLGRHREALVDLEATKRWTDQLGDPWLGATAQGWMGWSLEQLQDYARAIPHRQAALEMFIVAEDTTGIIFSQLGLGWSQIKTGDFAAAETSLRKCLEVSRRADNRWSEVQSVINLGVLFSDSEQYDRAMTTYQQALTLLQTTPNPDQRVAVLNNIGVLHNNAFRHDLAVETYRDVLDLVRETGNVFQELATLNNLGLATEALGEEAEAAVLFRQCVERGAELGVEDVTALTNLGRRLSLSRQPEAGEVFLRRALAETERRQNPHASIEVREQLGRCLSFQMRLDEALLHLNEADRLRREAGERRGRLPGLMRIAAVHYGRGDVDRATATYEEVAQLAAPFPFLTALARGHHSLVLAEAGQCDAAQALAEQVFAVVPDFDPLGPGGWFGFGGTYSAIKSTVRCQPGPDAVAAAFDALQHSKSKPLLAYIEAGQRRIEPNIPPALRQRSIEARRQVDRILAELERAPPAPGDSLEVALAEARAEEENVRRQVFAADDRFQKAAAPTPVRWERLGPWVMEHQVLALDFVAVPECEPLFACPVLVFALDASGITVHDLGPTEQVTQQIALLHDLLARTPEPDDSATLLLLARLGERLLGPVADRIANAARVIVSPGEVLDRVPFGALRVAAADGEPAYLIERVPITTVPSLSVLFTLRAEPREQAPRWDMAVWRAATASQPETELGGSPALAPLPHAEREQDLLLSGFARSTSMNVPLDPETPVAAKLSRDTPLGQSRVLHFIAHGYFDDRQPWRSGLYLQPPRGAEREVRLEIADVYELDFRCDLVTLSACDTGRSAGNPGTGLQGFSQALLGSGAAALLATQWSIDDASTPDFMASFYRGLAQSQDTATSLRAAQLSFLNHPTLRHPYYWAPYVLIGDGHRLVSLEPTTAVPWSRVSLGAGLVLLVAGLWLLRRARA